MHLSRQDDCWWLRCSWSSSCQLCSNYIFILNLTPLVNGLCKDNCKRRQETCKFYEFGADYIRGLTARSNLTETHQGTIQRINRGHAYISCLCSLLSYKRITWGLLNVMPISEPSQFDSWKQYKIRKYSHLICRLEIPAVLVPWTIPFCMPFSHFMIASVDVACVVWEIILPILLIEGTLTTQALFDNWFAK